MGAKSSRNHVLAVRRADLVDKAEVRLAIVHAADEKRGPERIALGAAAIRVNQRSTHLAHSPLIKHARKKSVHALWCDLVAVVVACVADAKRELAEINKRNISLREVVEHVVDVMNISNVAGATNNRGATNSMQASQATELRETSVGSCVHKGQL